PSSRSEGSFNGTQNFTVTLSQPLAQSCSVDFATSDVTATAGSDYAATSGTLTFAPGETTKTVSVTIYGDTQIENDETFRLNLSNAVNVALGVASATGTIVNDDFPTVNITGRTAVEGNSGTTQFIFAMTLSAPAPFPVTVWFATANGTATAGS